MPTEKKKSTDCRLSPLTSDPYTTVVLALKFSSDRCTVQVKYARRTSLLSYTNVCYFRRVAGCRVIMGEIGNRGGDNAVQEDPWGQVARFAVRFCCSDQQLVIAALENWNLFEAC
jgi:hypothetical protein